MRIDVFTLFPALVDDFCAESLLGKCRTNGLLDLRCHDLREHTSDVHRTVDDAPFGGGAGMVMQPGPIFASVEAARPPRPLFLLGPGGRRFDQALANELAVMGGFSLLCGRYEVSIIACTSSSSMVNCQSEMSCCRAVRWPRA